MALIKTDAYIESVQLVGNTPAEKAAHFVEIVNAAHLEERKGMSKIYDEMMDVTLYDSWRLEIDGEHFAILQWNTIKIPTKEEFFPELEEDNNKDG